MSNVFGPYSYMDNKELARLMRKEPNIRGKIQQRSSQNKRRTSQRRTGKGGRRR